MTKPIEAPVPVRIGAFRSAKALVLVGGFLVAGVLPSTLTIFIGPKIIADPSGFSERVLCLGQSLYYLGFALSGLLATPVSDLFGRKPVMYSLAFTALVLVLCGAGTTSSVLFVVSLFASGFFASSSYVAYVLCKETTSGMAHVHSTSILNFGFSILSGVMAFVCTRWTAHVDWRLETACWYMIVYGPLLMLGPFFVEESPLFTGGAQAAAGQERALAPEPNLVAPTPNTSRSPLAKLFGKDLRVTTVATCLCWCTVCLAFFALSFGAHNLSDDLGMNMMLFAAVDALSYGAGTSIASAVGGARRLQFCSFLIAGVEMLGLARLPRESDLVMPGAMLGRFLVNLAFTCVMMLIVEHFPADCGTSAAGVANFCGRMCAIAAPLCGSLPLATLFQRFGVMMLCASCATWLLPAPGEESEDQPSIVDWHRLSVSWCESLFSTLPFRPRSPAGGPVFTKGQEPLLWVDNRGPVDLHATCNV